MVAPTYVDKHVTFYFKHWPRIMILVLLVRHSEVSYCSQPAVADSCDLLNLLRLDAVMAD